MAARSHVIRTSRLSLTTWLADDLSDLHGLHADPDAMRFMRSGVEDLEQTRQRIAAFLTGQDDPGTVPWRVADRQGRLVGRAGFHLRPSTGHRELGFVLTPELWRAGHATEVARALLSWHANHPAVGVSPRVRALVFSANAASRTVLDKVGLHLIGSDASDPRQLVYETCRTDRGRGRVPSRSTATSQHSRPAVP